MSGLASLLCLAEIFSLKHPVSLFMLIMDVVVTITLHKDYKMHDPYLDRSRRNPSLPHIIFGNLEIKPQYSN